MSERAATVSFGVGVVVTYGILYGAVEFTRLVSLGSWVSRHRWAVGVVVVVAVVAGVAVAWRCTSSRPWLGVTVASMVGFVEGVLLTTLVVAAFAWIRHQTPSGDYQTVPVVHLDVGDYVALGDSYSAGEGVRPYIDGTQDPPAGNDCHRSTRAYPQLLRFDPPLARPVSFRACSGARSGQVFDHVQHDALQVDHDGLSQDVGLITITMGGNDAHFSGVLIDCFEKRDCLHETFDPGSHRRDEITLPAPAPLETWTERALPDIQQRLTNVFRRLRQAAPRARIIVVGYPQLFPEGGAPSRGDDCDIVLRQFDAGERSGLRDLETKLNTATYHAAADADVEFVDPDQFFRLHEGCGVLGQFINTVKPKAIGVDRGAFHPTVEGQRALAHTVACYLRSYPKAFDPHRTISLPGKEIETGLLKPAPGTQLLNPLGCRSAPSSDAH